MKKFKNRILNIVLTISSKKFKRELITISITLFSAFVLFAEITQIKIPNLIILTEIWGLYIFYFVIRLCVRLELPSRELPWACSSIYVISFLVSFQGLRLQNGTLLLSFFSSIFIGILGIVICFLLSSFFYNTKRYF